MAISGALVQPLRIWLSNVIKSVGLSNCGTLPDFGNFCVKREKKECVEEYDRYKGGEEMMPFAKGVSAKKTLMRKAIVWKQIIPRCCLS